MKNTHLYPENWNDTIRPDILKRDNYKCTICGVAHRATGYYDKAKNFIIADSWLQQWAIANGYKIQKLHLQIMHLNHMKDDCNYSNLAAGCPKCHLNYDREFNSLLRKMAGRQKKKTI